MIAVGTYNLVDDLITNSFSGQMAGTFNTNNFDVTANGTTLINSGNNNFGTTTWTANSTGTCWNNNVIVDGANMTIYCLDASASNKTVAVANGQVMGDLLIAPGGAGLMRIQNNSTNASWRSIKMSAPGTKSITFNSNHTFYITGGDGSFLEGTPGNIITISASTPGTKFNLISSTRISTDYISLQDSWAAGTVPFFAGDNSTNVSNNVNWQFTDSPGIAWFTA